MTLALTLHDPALTATSIEEPSEPDPEPSPKPTRVEFERRLGEWAKAKGHAKTAVRQVQGRVARRARVAQKLGKWALAGREGVLGEITNTNLTDKAKGNSAPSFLQDILQDKSKAQADMANIRVQG